MKVKIVLLWLMCVCISAIAQEKKYVVKGRLTGAKVPMKVFLFYRDGDRKVADSTIAKNNKFSFSGILEQPTEAVMYVHSIYPEPKGLVSQGGQFMLGPGTIRIEGEDFNTAKITAGQDQLDYVELNKITSDVRDSTYRIWKAQQGVLPEDSLAAFNRLIYAQRVMARNALKKFIQTHPKSAASFNILQSNTLVIEDIPFVESLLEALKPGFGSTNRFKSIEEKVGLTKRLSVGQPAMNFSQTDDKGKLVSLSDLKGKYVLIDFWASWCGPCREEYPFLKKAYAQFKDKNMEIIGISLDDKKANWLNAIQSNGFQWIQLSDLKGPGNAVAKAYGVSAIPQNFLVDPQGKIIARNLRGEELLSKLAEVLH
jgi:peroxiredoxin